MNADYRIVAALPSHLEVIPAIEQAAAAMFPERDLPVGIRYRVTDSETLREAQQTGRMWVAADYRDEAVGFAMVTEMDGQPHLDEMDVLPAHCRRGIGTRLVEYVIDWASGRSSEWLTLITFRHLPWNGPFYARLGFAPAAPADVGPQMRSMLQEERRAGLPMENRQIMRLALR